MGAVLAEANKHKEAAGLLQSAATTPPDAALALMAGEEWLKAGQPQLAVTPLKLAVQQPNVDARARRSLGVAYILSGRASDAASALSQYLDGHPTDATALLAALYSTYARHLPSAQAATLVADRANMAKWSKAYLATKAPLQSLVTAWAKYVQQLK